jgi:predicted ArsR family transcriptional regulator
VTDQLPAGLEIGHPERLRIMRACAVVSQSPKTMATREVSLQTIAYHFRVLHQRGLIEVHDQVRRRGSIQTYYVLSDTGRELLGDD